MASAILMKTNVYVDGFNLYYGCLKGTPYRWLDLAQLCQVLLPSHQIHRIRYFTALVQARSDDPQRPQRQQTYLRALRTIPNLSIHYGHFQMGIKQLPLAYVPPTKQTEIVSVLKLEEKQSDVNLATALLVDGFTHDFDAAVVISNDSDLLAPVRAVDQQLGCQVGILNPHHRKRRSRALYQVATFCRQVSHRALQASQFPHTLTDAHGTITKPQGW